MTLNFLILLPPAPESWDYRHAAICLVSVVLGREPRSEHTLGKRSTNELHPGPLFNFIWK